MGLKLQKISDHKFSKFLRKKDPNWDYKHFGNWTIFYSCQNEVLAAVLYSGKNKTDMSIYLKG